MKRMKLFTLTLMTCVGLAVVAGSIAIAADPPKESKPMVQKEMKLPAGWTEADMQACMAAATPGEQHRLLAESVGVWSGKATMWMGPGSEPAMSESKSTATPIMDGRYIRYEYSGEMPGMGPYSGFGIQGFDNVSKKFVCIWIDNHSTGIMNGVGELSPDGKTITWTYTYNCPINKRPTTMREVEKITGPNTKTLEMFGPDPKSGKEYQMMRIELSKGAGGASMAQ